MTNKYYSGGMVMPGRKYSGGNGYRYGFNGKELDNEVKGETNQMDYGMRIYDSRLGRFLSVDPLTKKYPYLTPYQFASNRPLDGDDLDGGEWRLKTIIYEDKSKNLTQINNIYTVRLKVINSTNMSDEDLKKHLDILKSGAEQILQNKIETQSAKNKNEKIQITNMVKIEYDFTNTKANADQGFTIEAVKSFSTSAFDQGTVTLGNTREIGNTQNNKITLATDQTIFVPIPGQSVKIDNSLSRQAKSLAEEIGHSGSLNHTGINSLGDRPDETDKNIISFTPVMDGNTNVMIQRGTSGIYSTINFFQFVKIWNTVQKDSTPKTTEKSTVPIQ